MKLRRKPMTRAEIKAAIDRVCAPGEARRDRAEGPAATLYPTTSDWMTDEEMTELHRLQLLWSAHPENSTAATHARCAARRAARRESRALKNDGPKTTEEDE